MCNTKERFEWVLNKRKGMQGHLEHARQEHRTVEQHEFYLQLNKEVVDRLIALFGQPEETWDRALENLTNKIFAETDSKGCFVDKRSICMDLSYIQKGYYD